jgi:hypothetical protein
MLAMTPLMILFTALLAAVVVVLLIGIAAMLKGGEFNRKYGNILMRWRIGLQLAALIIVALLLFSRSG